MSDAINPSHYKGLFELKENECIRLSRTLDFDMGNYIKYIFRVGNKDAALQDFRKARWYATDWITSHFPAVPDGPLFNPCAEKASIAFDFIKVPEFGTELWDRWHLMRVVTQPFIVGHNWLRLLNEYEAKYLRGDHND